MLIFGIFSAQRSHLKALPSFSSAEMSPAGQGEKGPPFPLTSEGAAQPGLHIGVTPHRGRALLL